MNPDPVGRRVFTWAKSAGSVVVSIFPPIVDGSGFRSKGTVEGIGPDVIEFSAKGTDSLQALWLAIERIGVVLKPYASKLRLHGDPFLALPKGVPSGFSKKTDARIEAVLEQEMHRLAFGSDEPAQKGVRRRKKAKK